MDEKVKIAERKSRVVYHGAESKKLEWRSVGGLWVFDPEHDKPFHLKRGGRLFFFDKDPENDDALRDGLFILKAQPVIQRAFWAIIGAGSMMVLLGVRMCLASKL